MGPLEEILLSFLFLLVVKLLRFFILELLFFVFFVPSTLFNIFKLSLGDFVNPKPLRRVVVVADAVFFILSLLLVAPPPFEEPLLLPPNPRVFKNDGMVVVFAIFSSFLSFLFEIKRKEKRVYLLLSDLSCDRGYDTKMVSSNVLFYCLVRTHRKPVSRLSLSLSLSLFLSSRVSSSTTRTLSICTRLECSFFFFFLSFVIPPKSESRKWKNESSFQFRDMASCFFFCLCPRLENSISLVLY